MFAEHPTRYWLVSALGWNANRREQHNSHSSALSTHSWAHTTWYNCSSQQRISSDWKTTLKKKQKQRSPAVVREDALQPIQFLLQYWPSRSSKVNDSHVTWKGVCHFLLMITSILAISLVVSKMWPVSLKNAQFSYSLRSTPNLKTFLLHCIPQILRTKSLRIRLIIHAKSFPPTNQHLDSIHPWWTDKRMTDDSKKFSAR